MPFDSEPEHPFRRLLLVADAVEDVPGNRYDQCVWRHEDSCGTTACALGWGIHRFADQLDAGWGTIRYGTLSFEVPVLSGIQIMNDGGRSVRWNVVADHFGITEKEAQSLFDGDEARYDEIEPAEDYRSYPSHVARCIRLLVEEKMLALR